MTITRYINPICPVCGLSHTLRENDEAIANGEHVVASSGRIMEVATGTYGALKANEGKYDSIYVGGEHTPTAVGITAPECFTERDWADIAIQKVGYSCSKCGATWDSPYDLASAIAEASANIWKRKDSKNGK